MSTVQWLVFLGLVLLIGFITYKISSKLKCLRCRA